MYVPQINRQSLLDSQADLRAEFQHARKMSNPQAMRAAFKDICAIDEVLREGKVIEYHELN